MSYLTSLCLSFLIPKIRRIIYLSQVRKYIRNAQKKSKLHSDTLSTLKTHSTVLESIREKNNILYALIV